MRMSYLEEFIVLAQHLNFSAASERLHMTQPGLSRHIAAMEKEIGVKLLNRDSHGVELTEKGGQFLEGIKKIVIDYELLCKRMTQTGSQHLSIGVPYFGVNAYLSPFVPGFEAAYPHIELSYVTAYPDEIVDAVLFGTTDLAIFPEVDFVNSDRLTFHHAFKEPLSLALNCDHPLALKKKVHLRDLKHERFISIAGNYGDAMFGHEYDCCRRHGFEPAIIMATDTIEAAVLKMRPNAAVMLLPRHVKGANISRDVTWVDIMDDDCYFDVSLVHNAGNKNPAIETFIDHYFSQVKK